MTNQIDSYRDLIVWQRGIDLVEHVYGQTGDLPKDERFGLVAQMRRSAVSVPSNIAEGWGRGTRNDYVRYLRTARGSLFELSTQAEICKRLGFAGDWTHIMDTADEVRRILQGLIRSLDQ
ncbi:MAG: four helix bundle protein [Planctomycetes bacterium]|nr:four helix bundle protein [Planctomycetota bacterium]